jgi:hypothetical protein
VHHPTLRSAALGIGMLTLLFIPVSSVNADATPVTACPSTTAAQPGASTPGSTTQATEIPTQAAVQPEQNPPGDIPDNQAFVTYTSTAGGYSITMPEGWARTENGSNVQFRDKLHTFTVEIACAVTALTVDSVTQTEVPTLAQQIPAFELVDVKAVNLPAGPAVLVQYRTNSAPDDVTGKQYRLDVDRYEISGNGKVAIVSLAVPAGSDNVDVSNQVSQSFRWTP